MFMFTFISSRRNEQRARRTTGYMEASGQDGRVYHCDLGMLMSREYILQSQGICKNKNARLSSGDEYCASKGTEKSKAL